MGSRFEGEVAGVAVQGDVDGGVVGRDEGDVQ